MNVIVNAIISVIIIIGMLVMAYRGDDRIDIHSYTVPASKVQNKAKAPKPFHGHGHDPHKHIRVEEVLDPTYKWERPSHWIPTRLEREMGGITLKRLGSYDIGVGKHVVDCSITKFGGTVESNINRWRGQVNLETLSSEELLKSLEKRQAPLGEYHLAILMNPQAGGDSMAGAIYPVDGGLLFVRFKGATEAIDGLRDQIKAFCDTLALRKAEDKEGVK